MHYQKGNRKKSNESIPWIQPALLFPLLFSCSKEFQVPPSPPCDPCDTIKPWVWIHQFDTLSAQQMLAVDPVMYKGDPLYVLHDPFSCNFGSAQRVTCLDAETGVKLWGFDLPDTCGSLNNAYLHDDFLLINSNEIIMGFDLRTRQRIWEIPIEKPMRGSFGLSGVGDKAYLGVDYGTSFNTTGAGMLQIDMATGSWKELFHVSKEQAQGSPVFNPPTLWENATGDSSFLFLTMARYNWPAGPGSETYALMAYDLKKDKLIWVADSIGYPTNNYRRLEIYEDKVLLPVGSGVQCYDIATGNKQWEKTMPCCAQYNTSFSTSRLLAAEGKVLAPTTEQVYCLDIQTGKILWEQTKYAANANNDPLLHNGVIYMASAGDGNLVGLDFNTGKVMMREFSPNKSTNITKTNVLLNKEKNLIYTFDFLSAIAFRPVR